MQQLTQANFARQWVSEEEVIRWIGPMPETQQQAISLCHQTARLLQARQGEPDWGADRLQVRFSADNFELVFNVEWLCEAVWLEPVGASSEQLTKVQMLEHTEGLLRACSAV